MGETFGIRKCPPYITAHVQTCDLVDYLTDKCRLEWASRRCTLRLRHPEFSLRDHLCEHMRNRSIRLVRDPRAVPLYSNLNSIIVSKVMTRLKLIRR